jgi:glycerol-3-phosphate dehydrogenase
MAVAVIGGGVVGAAVAWSLARRGVETVLLEAEDDLACGASGTNSGVLHTGFDSVPGELETELILRSAQLRDPVLEQLGVPVLRCGARMDADPATAERARLNGVHVTVRDGVMEIPGEMVSDPVAFTKGLAGAAGETWTGTRVDAISDVGDGLEIGTESGDEVFCQAAVNAAGLFADEVARLVGDDSFEIYPRKGEFFVFDTEVEQILLPLPTARTKGVLVFPTVDGMTIAGPTAVDQDDKRDRSVRAEARAEVMAKAVAMHPPLEGLEPVAAYAGLRPAGRGVNYLIAPSPACSRLINVAAIRSTGVTASLAIGELVVRLVAEQGVELGPEQHVEARAPAGGEPWWQRSA